MDESIVSAVKSLQDLLSEKEKQLQGRIKDFDKRAALFEKANPEAGKSSDVLMLNVGGEQNVAVLRSTLTHYEDSMLAAKFSGRWDDALEKDSEGHFFIDQDPENFRLLLSFLRDRANICGTELQPRVKIRSPPLSFCYMVKYYELMPFVFPMEWTVAGGTAECVEKRGETMKFLTETESGLLSMRPSNLHDLRISSCSVLVPWNAKVGIGWATNSHNANTNFRQSSYFAGVSLKDRQFVAQGGVAKSFAVDEDGRDAFVVECSWDKSSAFSICISGNNVESPIAHTFSLNNSWYPAIAFAGTSIPITTTILDYVYPNA